jgi:hypothetical protein
VLQAVLHLDAQCITCAENGSALPGQQREAAGVRQVQGIGDRGLTGSVRSDQNAEASRQLALDLSLSARSQSGDLHAAQIQRIPLITLTARQLSSSLLARTPLALNALLPTPWLFALDSMGVVGRSGIPARIAPSSESRQIRLLLAAGPYLGGTGETA